MLLARIRGESYRVPATLSIGVRVEPGKELRISSAYAWCKLPRSAR